MWTLISQRLLAVILVVALLVSACDEITSPNEDTSNDDIKEQILFASNRAATSDTGSVGGLEKNAIYRMNPDGFGITQLTELRSENESHFSVSVSPSGEQLAFTVRETTQNGNYLWYIFTANADGSNMSQVTPDNFGYVINPEWSPIDSRIAYARLTQETSADIYTIDAENENITQITHTDSVNEYSPAWSPNGNKIAYTRGDEGNYDIHIKDLATGDIQQITDNQYRDDFPHWSPDGSQLVFRSNRDGDAELYLIDSQGTNLQKLTDNDARDTGGTWSPDGENIAFNSDRSGNMNIYRRSMNEPQGVSALTEDPASDAGAYWDSLKVNNGN